MTRFQKSSDTLTSECRWEIPFARTAVIKYSLPYLRVTVGIGYLCKGLSPSHRPDLELLKTACLQVRELVIRRVCFYETCPCTLCRIIVSLSVSCSKNQNSRDFTLIIIMRVERSETLSNLSYIFPGTLSRSTQLHTPLRGQGGARESRYTLLTPRVRITTTK